MVESTVGETNTVLRVSDLSVDFDVRGQSVNILSNVSFGLERGQTLGIIGESGCGKSMTALALLRMVPSPPGRVSNGQVLLNDEDILTVSKNRINKIRGKEGQLRLADIDPQIYEVFVITKLNKLFQIFDSADQALASFS